jgi:hypothetical protein
MQTVKWTMCLAVAACGGPASPPPAAAPGPVVDPAARFGPLEVGADWATYTKVNREPVVSRTHGGRLVDTWVNATGLAAYQSDEAAIPPGTVIVKTSRETSGAEGPIFVMAKGAPGTSPHDDWTFAIHWADPPPAWRAKVGGPVYWRSPSAKADYCWECHEGYDRHLGGVPAAQRAY